MDKNTILISIIIVVLAILVFNETGFIDNVIEPLFQEKVSIATNQQHKLYLKAESYLDYFSLNNNIIRSDAINIVKGCEENDKSCFINAIYNYVINNYRYISDPMVGENIQFYNYTKYVRAGDCEDISILIGSLLENIGIKTYFVITDDHGYILACANELDKELLGQQSNRYSQMVKLEKDSLEFVPFKYIGEEKNLNLDYGINSNRLVSVFVVASEDEFEFFSQGKSFTHYTECAIEKEFNKNKKCRVGEVAGFMIKNEYNGETELYLKINIYQHIKGNVKFYNLGGRECIVLDGTAGPNSYPGYEGNINGIKTAVDLVSKEVFILS